MPATTDLPSSGLPDVATMTKQFSDKFDMAAFGVVALVIILVVGAAVAIAVWRLVGNPLITNIVVIVKEFTKGAATTADMAATLERGTAQMKEAAALQQQTASALAAAILAIGNERKGEHRPSKFHEPTGLRESETRGGDDATTTVP
jgi:hypothetical protein